MHPLKPQMYSCINAVKQRHTKQICTKTVIRRPGFLLLTLALALFISVTVSFPLCFALRAMYDSSLQMWFITPYSLVVITNPSSLSRSRDPLHLLLIFDTPPLTRFLCVSHSLNMQKQTLLGNQSWHVVHSPAVQIAVAAVINGSLLQ